MDCIVGKVVGKMWRLIVILLLFKTGHGLLEKTDNAIDSDTSALASSKLLVPDVAAVPFTIIHHVRYNQPKDALPNTSNDLNVNSVEFNQKMKLNRRKRWGGCGYKGVIKCSHKQ